MPAMKRKRAHVHGPSESPPSFKLSPEPSSPAKPRVVPEPTPTSKPAEQKELTDPPPTFDSFNLDKRLLRGIRDQKWSNPTEVQRRVIPIALEGKDTLVRSGTGTGKSAAYLLPVLQNAIQKRQALILVPTKELALQTEKLAKSLGAYCGVRVHNIAGKETEVAQRARLADRPDIVVSTPARAKARMQDGALSVDRLSQLVVDEFDLIAGYGLRGEMEEISKSIPKGVQIFLMSATLNTELENLQGLFCRDPVRLDLQDPHKDSQLVAQYRINTSEEEKFFLIMALFLLKLIKGKAIIFVGDIDRSYRVKLFLEQFGVKSCVLNSELPLASRLHIVDEFNKGVYDIIVASDETEVLSEQQRNNSKPQKKKPKSDKQESGVSRGIDFLNVSCVLNFDFPDNYKSYFHRIGRTARAGKPGTAISFIIPKDKFRKHKPTFFIGAERDEEVLGKVIKRLPEGQKIEDYTFDLKKLEPFRYRFGDALRAVTRIAVREARLKELRSELLKSQKLSRYFEENPESKEHLQHDLRLTHPARIQPHLKHVPDYLLPGGKKAEGIGLVGLEKEERGRPKIVRRKNRAVRTRSGKIDPLKTFNKRGRGKK